MHETRRQQKRSGRTPKACMRCQKKKIKCDGSRPCLSCVGSRSKCTYNNQGNESCLDFFQYSNSLSHDLQDVKYSITKLSSRISSNAPAVLQKSLNEISTLLEQIQPHLYLNIESEEMKLYKGTQSIETEIIGDGFCCLNRYSSSLKKGNGQPLTVYFGMYSPLLFFTPMGISYIIKKIIAYSDCTNVRETIYLLLKFLDVSSAKYETKYGAKSLSPLKQYADVNGLFMDEKEIVEYIISKRSNASNQTLEWSTSKLDKSYGMFVYSVSLMQDHFQTLNSTNLNPESLAEFFKEDESYFALCSEYFERSVFTEMHDLEFLGSLVEFIKCRYWIEDITFMGRLISVMCRRSLDAGLNRWEYYAFKSEAVAETHRKLWWNCYWWDKWYAFNSGKPSLISDETTWCLFPKDVMEMGVDDSMDCLTLIKNVELDFSKTDACVSFGHIMLGKLISKISTSLLYNRRFTDYRLFGISGSINLTETLKQLKEEFSSVQKIFVGLKEMLIPVLKNGLGNDALFELFIQIEHSSVCCYQAIESLLKRIQNLLPSHQKNELTSYLKQVREDVFKISIDILLTILESKNTVQIIKASWSVFVIILNMSSHLISSAENISPYNLSIISGVLNLYSNILGNFSENTTEIRPSLGRLRLGITSSFILTRICFQVYMISEKISLDQLIEILRKYGESCAEISKSIMSIDFVWYKNLVNNHHQSGFSKEILRHIDRHIDDFVNNKTDTSNDVDCLDDTALLSKISASSSDFGTLDSPLNCDSSLNFLTDFWNDVQSNIFDYTNEEYT